MIKTSRAWGPILALFFCTLTPAAQSLDPISAEDLLNVRTANVLDLSDDGRRVAIGVRKLADNATTDHRRYGDPTYFAPSMVELMVIDVSSGAADRVGKGLLNVRQAAWNATGGKLAFLTAAETSAGLPVTTLWVYDADRKTLSEVPRHASAKVAANSEVAWTPDAAKLFVALRSPEDDKTAQASFKALVSGPIVVQSSKPFLDWDAMSRGSRRRSLAEIDPATGAATVIVPPAPITNYQWSRDGSFVTWMEDSTEKTNYDVIFGTDNALRLLARGSEARTVVDAKTLKTMTPRWSDDHRVFAYADKGEIFVQRIDEAKPRSITPKPQKDSGGPPPAADAEAPESFSAISFSRDGSKLLITSKKGWYVADVADGSRERVLTLDDKNEEKNPRLTAVDWTPSGDAILVQYGEADRWDRGLSRLDLTTKTLTSLVRDDGVYQGFRVSRDGRTMVFQKSDGTRPAELYTADAAFGNVRKLTDLNPWIAKKALPASELVSYRDADGKVLYGVLRYPIGYEQGRRYPTVFEIYETFFDNGFNGRAAMLAGHGYAVFHPSVNLVVGRPGESWAKGVTAAANKLIDMGVADADRLGVHGTSYGGYATVLLLTETDRFKAAINISGKVNMVSFYTDSERLGVRNTHAPEKSQDRIGGTLWEFPERYIEHSAIFRLDRVKTPLLTISGDQDPNVPANQSRELYYALRRLGKEVEWVRYVNGGHRPPNSVAESIDFEQRIVAWYDKYLKPKPATTTSASR
ncbi:MAG TPA: prolyl oligopeptidase family serine peptidase [Vicinamibacterales bacterium]|nr:prolyl oligopeptidase family serine peptidase [Vicinamibacterales bacterium]